MPFPYPEYYRVIVGFAAHHVRQGKSPPQIDRLLRDDYRFSFLRLDQRDEIIGQALANVLAAQRFRESVRDLTAEEAFGIGYHPGAPIGARVYFHLRHADGTVEEASVTVNVQPGTTASSLRDRVKAFVDAGGLTNRGRGTAPGEAEEVEIYGLTEGGYPNPTFTL